MVSELRWNSRPLAILLALPLLFAGDGARSQIGPENTKAPLRALQIAEDFKLVQISKDVYAFISGNTTHSWEDGNTAVIITESGVVVVDASTTYLARRHLAEIRKLTTQPVRYVITTHWHRDHLMGDHVYKEAFPDVKVIMQAYAAHVSDVRNPAIMQKVFRGKDGRDYLQSLKDAAEKGVDKEGKVLSGYDLMRAKPLLPRISAGIRGCSRRALRACRPHL